MKYSVGQTVMLLDTTFKPVTKGMVKEVNPATIQYYVEYQYPGSSKIEYAWMPQERLTLAPELANATK